MAHSRSRHLLEPFDEIIKFARITGVIGHRQTGKSTFVEKNSSEYFTLDDKETLKKATNNPRLFIESLSGKRSAIDECQLCPDLFPALKVKIGTSSIPGRYILTGSVRFSSRNAIRESLTGRLMNLEMLPFVVTEINNQTLSSAVIRLFEQKQLNGLQPFPNSLFREYLKITKLYFENGGLPGLCFIRSKKLQKNALKDILDLILNRDIRLIYPTTTPFEQIKNLCQIIADNPFKQIQYESIKREIGLTSKTVKKLINALESCFLIRPIEMLGDFKGNIYWFEDQMERNYFSQKNHEDEDWLQLFYRNVRAQFFYRIGENVKFYQYRTRSNAFVPLIIERNNTHFGFFVVKNSDEITPSLIRSSESFLKKYESSRIFFLLREENVTENITNRVLKMPLVSALF